MNLKIKHHVRNYILLVALLAWVAACVPIPQPLEAPAGTSTATPDPLLSIHCIRRSGRNDLCFAGEGLIGNRQLMQKAMFDYCENVAQYDNSGWCMIYLWKDEASVAQSWPLTEADTASQIASFVRRANIGLDCFTTYENGEITFKSNGCQR